MGGEQGSRCTDGQGGIGCGGCALAGAESEELVGEGVVLDCVECVWLVLLLICSFENTQRLEWDWNAYVVGIL